MIVEFIGLPASGKTTIAKGVYEILKKEYNVIYPLQLLYTKNWLIRNIYKSILVFESIIQDFNLSKLIVKNVLDSKQKYKLDIIRLTFNLIFFMSIRKRYKEKKDIVIFDEGFLHNYWALIVNSNEKNTCKLLKKIEPKLDIIISVSSSIETVCYRMKNRKKTNTRHNKFLNNIKLISSKMDNIIKYYIDKNHIKEYLLLNNDSESDLEVAIDKTKKIIINHYNQLI